MSNILFPEMLYIRHMAKRDGRELLRLPEDASPRYAVSISNSYLEKTKRVLNNARDINRTFRKIKNEYERIRKPLVDSEDAIKALKEEKEKLIERQEELEKQHKKVSEDIDKFHRTGCSEQSMAAETLPELKTLLEKNCAEQKKAEEKLKDLEKKIEDSERCYKAKKEEDTKKLSKYKDVFAQRLEKLWRKIERIRLAKQERLNRYWGSFRIRKKSPKQPVKLPTAKTLEELCAERKGKILQKDDLLPEERKIINGEIKDLLGSVFDI